MNLDISILQKDGYWKKYLEIIADHDTRDNKHAYEILESLLNDKFNISRYGSYNTFRNAKHQYFKKKKRTIRK